jgi:hypothetical protein
MDLNRFKSIVSLEIKTNPRESLKIQNHIYGCFVLMEDIAQSTVDVSGDEVLYPEFSFDLANKFGEIGRRYGFVSDERVALQCQSKEYKELWLETFHYIDLCRDIEEVDKIEDAIIELCKELPEEYGFFNNALATGLLPKEWIEKVLALLETPTVQKNVPVSEQDATLQDATLQNEIQQTKIQKRVLNITRSKKIRRCTPKRKYLNKTRKSS